MKKIILSLMAIAMVSFGAFASSQEPSNTPQTEQICKGDKECKKAGKKKGGKKDKKGGDKQGRKFNPEKRDLFKGITLTETQKTEIENLRKSLKPENGKEKSQDKANLTEEQRQALKEEKRQQKEAKKQEFLNGLKSILTPDQYVQFLENSYLSQDNSFKQGNTRKMKQPRVTKQRMNPDTVKTASK